MTNLNHHSKRKITVALAIASAIYMNPAVLAQQNGAQLEEIQVTGTRIRMTDGMAEPTPVTSITPLDLANFEPGGTVAEQLDALPQFFSTGTAQRGAPTLFGDGGGSYLDMRGLGRARSLVLLDGSRIVPADKLGFVNVDNIPTALVRSIDVITGGASAAYGADALGGVTNFVIDRQFEGFKMNVGTGMNEMNHDGKNYNMSVAAGRAFGDRWNVIGSVEMRHIDEIYRKGSDLDPDWFQRWAHMTNPRAGQPGEPARITKPWVTATSVSPSGVIRAPGSALNGLQFTDDGKALTPFILGDFTSAGFTSGSPEARRMDRATASPINGNGVENRSGFFGVQFQATAALRLHAQGMIGRVESTSIGEHATMIQSSPWSLQIFRGNPFIPANVASTLTTENRTSFLMDKAGSYLGDYEAGAGEYSRQVWTTESYSTGFNFELPNSWALSGNYQAGESRKKGGEYPSLRIDREALARDAVIHPVTGAIVCNVQVVNPTEAQLAAAPEIRGYIDERNNRPLTSPIGLDNSIRDCVPYNAMGAGQMTKAAWDYMHTPKTADSWVKQDFAELLLQGEAHEGWGAGPISFATGLTWREQSFHDEAAQAFIDSFGPPINVPSLGIRGISTSYTNGTPHLHNLSTINFLNGEYDVWEAFGEVNVPIWESGSGNQRLGSNVAFRRSEYSSSGTQDSWKVGLEFQIHEDLRLRATRSHDVREGTFSERFNIETGGANVNDPFSSTPTALVNISYQRVGDPNIRPERANTNVVGLVYQPSFLDGLQVSTDWYEVDIRDSIESISEQNIVDQCFQVGAFCNNLIRNSAGVLSLVRSEQKNLSLTRVEGVDMEMSYRVEPDFFGSEIESLSIRLLAGHLIERIDYPFLGAPINRVGGSTRPDYKGNMSLSYTVGPWSAQWTQRYVSDTLLNTTWVEGRDVDNNTIPTYSFTNLNLAYSGTDSTFGGDWRVSLAISNAFDKDPPTIPSSGARFGSQTSVSTGFDEFGRRYQLSLNMNF